jgi:N-acyl-L-homoserine lactone synthetase
MTLFEIMQDIHACEEDLLMYERKYNILSETFYAAYSAGEEPPDHASVLEWSDWAGAYQIWRRRRRQYQKAIRALQQQTPLMQIIEKAMRRETFPVPI